MYNMEDYMYSEARLQQAQGFSGRSPEEKYNGIIKN